MHQVPESSESVDFMPYGEKQLDAMINILEWKGTFPVIKPFVTCLSLVTVPVINNGDLAEEFRNGKKLLQPLIFSHGLTTHKMNYSSICREFASHGFLVIALNHNDRSCEYTTGAEIKIVAEDGTTH